MKIITTVRTLRTLIVGVALLVFTNVTMACSVCATGKEESRVAYYTTTAAMSFLPLFMLGGVIYYISKKYR